MSIADLIIELKKLPQDHQVGIIDPELGYFDLIIKTKQGVGVPRGWEETENPPTDAFVILVSDGYGD